MSGFIAASFLILTLVGIGYLVALPIAFISKLSGETPRWRRSRLNTILTNASRQAVNNRRTQANIENAIINAQWRYDQTWKGRNEK